MKKRINRILYVMRVGFPLLMVIGTIYVADTLAEGVAVIVNKTNTTDNVSFSDLVKYFSAQKRFWPNQKKVVIILPGTGSEEKEILLKRCTICLKMT